MANNTTPKNNRGPRRLLIFGAILLVGGFLAVVSFIFLWSQSVPEQVSRPIPPKPLPKAVVEAWKKAGARVGAMRVNRDPHADSVGYGSLVFVEDEVAKAGELPAFSIGQKFKKEQLATLPAPGVPFGLAFYIKETGFGELTRLKSLHWLEVGRGVMDEGAEEISRLTGLRRLSVFLCQDNGVDARVKKLARLRNLVGLELFESGITDIGAKELARLTNLQDLDLSATRITNAGLEYLARLKNLRSLEVTNTWIWDTGIKELAGLDNLQSLDVSHTGVKDTGLRDIAKLSGLSRLRLEALSITDAGLRYLTALQDLQSLCLRQTQITDAGVKELARLPNLQNLDLYRTQIKGSGLQDLARRKTLRSLNLRETQSSDSALKNLAGLSSLQKLILGSQATDAGLKHMARLTNLEELNLDVCYKVTDEGLKELARLKHLRILKLGGCIKVTAAGLKHLAGLKLTTLTPPGEARTDLGLKHYVAAVENPTTLDLSRWKVSDAGLQALAGLNLKKLKLPPPPTRKDPLGGGYPGGEPFPPKVPDPKGPPPPGIDPGFPPDGGGKSLPGYPPLTTPPRRRAVRTDLGLKHYLAALASPTKLDLGYWKISDKSLKELARLPNLKELRLYNTRITDKGLKDLHRLTSLEILDLRKTDITDKGLKELTSLRLKTLHIPPKAGTDLGLKHYLAALASPTKLDLGYWKISDKSLKELARLPNLKELRLYNTRITDKGLKDLHRLTSLEILDLRKTDITDKGLKELTSLRLKTLHIPPKAGTDLGLKYYLAATVPNTTLDLEYWSVTDDGLKLLIGRKLHSLDLSRTRISGAAVDVLVRLRDLQELFLHYTSISKVGRDKLRKALPGCKIFP